MAVTLPGNADSDVNVYAAYPELTGFEGMLAAVSYPHPSLVNSYEPGTTEPWIAEAVCGLLKAYGGAPTVLETGGFLGVTSAWLYLTLMRMGGGSLLVCDIEKARADAVAERLAPLAVKPSPVALEVHHGDVLALIANTPSASFDFVWLDDDHQKHHVEQEIVSLWPKMKPGGIICFHDVWGVCDLQSLVKKYGGVALDLPKLGPAGGLGILQIPR